MITELIYDIKEYPAGTPVEFLDFMPAVSTPRGRTEMILVRLPDGREIEVDAGKVSSGAGTSPEETLPELERQTGIDQNTLLVAIRQGRLLARRSAKTWLSTLNAVEWAVVQGKIRKSS